MSLIKKLIAGLFILAAPTGWCQTLVMGDTDVWKLLPQAQVDSAGVYLDQIFAPFGAAQVPHLRLTRAPQAGSTLSLTRNEISRLAHASPADLLLTNWAGALEVHVTRHLRAFEEQDVVELLTATLQKEYVKNQGELELQLTRPWTKPQVPDELLTMKVKEMPALGVMPAFIATFELWAGKERVGSWQVAARASVWRDIPVARSGLARGDALKGADITMERSDVLVQRDVFMNFPTLNEALELNENVPAGRPILNRMVRTRPVLLRGQLVEAIFQEGSLEISLMVETLEDGTLGQTVRVRNPKTKRELYGKVESEKTVRITL